MAPAAKNPASSATSTNRNTAIRRRLLAWYDAHHRQLPWRNARDPYAIWISEIMLQQTQVATVIPFYDRFMQSFPTVVALADADLDKVLKHWAGLGYYSRARNLHRAARMIREDFGDEFPETYEDLRALPGVGDYTAGAIASIAFEERIPAVDGNVLRVISRIENLNVEIDTPNGRNLIRERTELLLPRKRVGDFNQSLMELGARICLPNSAARCLTCPLRNQCAAFAANTVAKLPKKRGKTAPREAACITLALRNRDRYLFRRRPESGLWGGLWELPTVETNSTKIKQDAKELLASHLPNSATKSRELHELIAFGQIRHQLTHRSMTFHGFRAALPAGSKPVPADDSTQWLTLEEARKIGISTAMKKVIKALELSLEP